MDMKFDAKTAIKKRDVNKIIKAIAYGCGFPLFVVFVFLGSIPFMNGSAFAATKNYGVIAAIIMWAIIIVVQLIASAITKNSSGRALICIIMTLVVMIGGAMFVDSWAEKQINSARVQYVRDTEGLEEDEEVDLADYPSIPIKNFNYQVNSYVPWTKKSGLVDSYNATVNEFMRVYNVGYGSSVKGSTNTDGSAYGPALEKDDGELEYWFGEKGAVYKENGLYADGYIFGISVASEILITYYETQALYEKQGKDADAELDLALKKAAASSEWKAYKNSDEYKAAYGEGGTAEKYMITEGRLNLIAKALGTGLSNGGIWDFLRSNEGTLKLITGMFLEEGITIAKLNEMGINEAFMRNMTLDSLIDLVETFGLELSAEDIMSLLAAFSDYQVSDVKPVMYFIEDETLRTYAYAKYFGNTHGKNIGSVLIPDKSVDENNKTTYGNVGHITMSTSGLNYSENAFSLNAIYELRANSQYAPTVYPLFAMRRYAYIFAGIIALMFVIYYYMEMKTQFFAIRLERMSTLGGAR